MLSIIIYVLKKKSNILWTQLRELAICQRTNGVQMKTKYLAAWSKGSKSVYFPKCRTLLQTQLGPLQLGTHMFHSILIQVKSKSRQKYSWILWVSPNQYIKVHQVPTERKLLKGGVPYSSSWVHIQYVCVFVRVHSSMFGAKAVGCYG